MPVVGDSNNDSSNGESIPVNFSSSRPTFNPTRPSVPSASIPTSTPINSDRIDNSAYSSGSFSNPKQEEIINTNPSSPFVSASSSQPQQEDREEKSPQVNPIKMDGGSVVLSKKSNKLTLLLWILVLIVLVGGILGVYYWQNQKVTQLSSKISTLTSQNNNLKAETLQAQSITRVQINIKQLGLSLIVPGNLADLTAVTASDAQNGSSTRMQSVNLGATNLGTLDPACNVSASVAPLGVITKFSGKYTASAKSNPQTVLLKQFSNDYYLYTEPTKSCSTNNAVNNLIKTLMVDIQFTFGTATEQ